MATVTESDICSDREIFGQAHACCTFSPSPSPGPCPCPCVRKSPPFPLTLYKNHDNYLPTASVINSGPLQALIAIVYRQNHRNCQIYIYRPHKLSHSKKLMHTKASSV